MKFTTYLYTACLAWLLPSWAMAQEDYGAGTTKSQVQGMLNVNGSASDTLISFGGQMVGTLLSFVGIIFMILMIAGGFLYMTSQGNDTKIKNARKLITSAIIGLILIASAYVIVAFVGNVIPK
jgi:hypothetical protein